MNSRLITLLIPLALVGCETKRNPSAVMQKQAAPAVAPSIANDTFQLRNGQAVTWRQTAEANFKRLPAVPTLAEYPYDSTNDARWTLALEAARLQRTQSRVRRFGDTLVFYPNQATKPVRFTNTDCNKTDTCAVYWFLGELPNSSYWLVEVGYYEGGDYLLINQQTGHHVLTDDYPSISPSGHRVVAATSVDVYQTDGLSLWQADTRNQFKPVWQRNAEWFPREIRWADERTLYIKAGFADTIRYLQLRLPQ